MNLRDPLGAATLLAFVVVGCGGSGASETAASAVKPVRAKVVSVTERQVRRNVESVGTLFPMDEVTVGSEVDGRVARVLVDVGDEVALGRPMVEIAPAELNFTAEQQAAALDQARAQLGLPEGTDDLDDIDDAAQVKRAAADRDDAARKFARARSLFDEGLVSRGDYDEAEARARSTEAAYELARQDVSNLKAQVAQRTASLGFAKKKLADTVIRAPFTGQVKQRLVTTGQYVKVQTPVMVIVNADPLRLRLQVPEKAAADVAVGQTVSVKVDAHPDRVFEGRISRINPSVDPQTRTFDVEALLDNKDAALKPGFFAKATIASSRVDPELLVPGGALRYRYGVYKVFTVVSGRLKETDVKLGERHGDEVAITDGLTSRDAVAVPLEGEEPREGAPVETAR